MSLINISDLTFAYDGSYENIFEHVNLQLDTDWRLGFTGRNGRGKTTMLKLLMGEYEYQGSISASVAFEYFPYPVRDESRLCWELLEDLDGGLEQWRILREMAALELEEELLWRPYATLSPGERTKLLLAALFLLNTVALAAEKWEVRFG